MCLHCCVHTGACIADREQHIVTSGHAGLPTGVGISQLDIRRFDHKLPAVWHGIACVDHQVDDHLLNLHRVGLYGAWVRRQPHHSFDVFTDERAEELIYLEQQVVEVEDTPFDALLSSKGQKLARQASSTYGQLAYLEQISARLFGWRERI